MRCSTDPPCFFSINNLLCFKVVLWVLAISALSLSFVGFLNSFTSTFSASSKVIFSEKYIEEHLPANRKEIEKKIIICISDAFSNKGFFSVYYLKIKVIYLHDLIYPVKDKCLALPFVEETFFKHTLVFFTLLCAQQPFPLHSNATLYALLSVIIFKASS